MSKETIEERYEYINRKLAQADSLLSDEVGCLLDDLMAEREKMKELVKDRYEFPVNEWNEQLVQTINDKGCPAKIVLTRRNPSKAKED